MNLNVFKEQEITKCQLEITDYLQGISKEWEL